MEACHSVMRILENLPIVGHMLALMYACAGLVSRAERAAIKATLGIILAAVSLPVDLFDEILRKRSDKLPSEDLTQRPDWMKEFRHRTLRHLCLPASHHSGTYTVSKRLKKSPMVDGWAQCQKFDIWTQLIGGIRFLDLRLMSDRKTKEVWTHNKVIRCVKFREVLQSVRDFVRQYPSEIVSLHVSDDGAQLDWSQVRTNVHEYIDPTKLIPETMKDVVINDITSYGRNVIFYGIPDVAFCWDVLDYRWPNKSQPEEIEADMRRTLQSLVMYNPYFFFWYKAECSTNGSMKTRDLGGLPGACVAKKAAKFAFTEEMAAATNYKVLSIMDDVKRLPFNILSTDYVNDYIIMRIIEMNRAEEAGAGPMANSRGTSRLDSTSTTLNQSRLNSMLNNSRLTSYSGSTSSPGGTLTRSMASLTHNNSDVALISSTDDLPSPRHVEGAPDGMELDAAALAQLSRSLNQTILESSILLEDEDEDVIFAQDDKLLQVWESTM